MGAILGSYILSILNIILYMMYCLNENRKRGRAAAATGGDSQEAHFGKDFMDLASMQNPHCRYIW